VARLSRQGGRVPARREEATRTDRRSSRRCPPGHADKMLDLCSVDVPSTGHSLALAAPRGV